MCKTKEDFAAITTEPTKSSGFMGKRELHLSRRLVLEMYGVEDMKTGKRASKAFRQIKDLEFESYKRVIKDPIALDLIKDRLDVANPDQYKTMSEFMSDFRRMFINCRTYWAMNAMSHASAHHSGTIYTKYASLLEKTLDLKMKELTIGSQKKIPTSADKQFTDANKKSYYASRIKQDERDSKRPRMKIGKGKPLEEKDEDYKDKQEEEPEEPRPRKSKVETTRKCKQCEAVYDKLSKMRLHTVTHFEDEILPLLPKPKSNGSSNCPSCDESFPERQELLEHYAIEHYCLDEDLNGLPYTKTSKTNEDPTKKLDRGIEKAKRDLESRYKRDESTEDVSYKKDKKESESRKRDASGEDGNEDEELEDEALLLRKKKCQEMYTMYGSTEEGAAGQAATADGSKIAGLWGTSKETAKTDFERNQRKDQRKSKKKSEQDEFEYNSGEDNEDDRYDGNNNARSKSTQERIERVASYFKQKKDSMGGTPKRGAMIIPDDEGRQGYTRQRIRAKYAEEESE
jgi:hypothetical protein